jgi:predicted amidohydrolase YtcJ
MGDTCLGRLEPGMRADLVVLGTDPFATGTMPEGMGVEATLVDGRVRFDARGRFA